MGSKGFSLLEVLVAIAVLAIVAGAAMPFAHSSVDRSRTSAAASYVAARMARSRFEAVKRSAFVAIRFVESGGQVLVACLRGWERQRRVEQRHRFEHRPAYNERRAARLPLYGRYIRHPTQRDLSGSEAAVRCQRSHSDWNTDASELQPERLVDFRHRVHSGPGCQPIRGPHIGGDRPHAGF